jgi:branched-chain amino acid transport system ATP-binding protein
VDRWCRVTTAAVELIDVDAGFPAKPVLHQVSLTATAGEIVAIVGLNGAGKSVLGRTISGLVAVSHGRVLLGGVDVTDLAPRRRVALGLHHLSQRRGLVPELSVADNIRIAMFGAAALYDASTVANHPVLGQWHARRAGTLSGGEQALVALARAELLRPRVMVADEPTAGLAPAATDSHAAAMRDLAAAGTCVVLIEQNIRFARAVADRVVVLRSGTVALDVPNDGLSERALAGALLG